MPAQATFVSLLAQDQTLIGQNYAMAYVLLSLFLLLGTLGLCVPRFRKKQVSND